MSAENLSRNIIFVFNREIVNDFIVVDITNKLELVYDDIAVEVGSSALGGFRSVFTTTEPNVQIVAQDNKLMIVDNNILRSNVEPTVEFSKLTYNIVKLFLDKAYTVKSYGFNFNFSYKPEDTASTIEELSEKYLKADSIEEGLNLNFIVPSISFQENDTRYILAYAAQLDDFNVPEQINVTVNVSFGELAYSNEADSLNSAFIEQFNQSKLKIL